MESLTELYWDSFRPWFKSLKLFKEERTSINTATWVVVKNIPWYLWHEDFFRMLGNKWGNFIKVDGSTSSKKRFDRALLLVEEMMKLKGQLMIPVIDEPSVDPSSEEKNSSILVQPLSRFGSFQIKVAQGQTHGSVQFLHQRNDSGLKKYGPEVGHMGPNPTKTLKTFLHDDPVDSMDNPKEFEQEVRHVTHHAKEFMNGIKVHTWHMSSLKRCWNFGGISKTRPSPKRSLSLIGVITKWGEPCLEDTKSAVGNLAHEVLQILKTEEEELTGDYGDSVGDLPLAKWISKGGQGRKSSKVKVGRACNDRIKKRRFIGRSLERWKFNNKGGIITLWQEDFFSFDNSYVGRNYILMTSKINDKDWACGFSNIYAPNNDKLKEDVWIELLGIMREIALPWCLGGDFNAVLWDHERVRGVSNKREMEVTFSRLDRFLMAADMLERFLTLRQLNKESCKEVFVATWEESGKKHGKGGELWQRLRATKPAIKRWQTSLGGNFQHKIKVLEAEIQRKLQKWQASSVKGSHRAEIAKLKADLWKRRNQIDKLKVNSIEITDPSDLTEYRPISLVGSMYKVVAKVLANRLRVVIENVISPNQFAFNKGRKITDYVLIANELVDYLQKNREGRVFYKVDFEKAFNSVDWFFLEFVMAKVLSALVYKATATRLCKEVEIDNSGLIISYLQYADDTMIFSKSDLESVLKVKRVLRCFQNGVNIYFCDDEWIEGIILKVAFPHIFTLATNKIGKAKFKWPDHNTSIIDIIHVLSFALALTSRKQIKSKVSWECPPNSWFKFNTDELLRVVQVILALEGERSHSLVAASSWVNSSNIIIESDSKNVVSWVSNPSKAPWRLKQLILQNPLTLKQSCRWLAN
ncbi:Uncharacterized protein TCM_013883 [Theobroma cacao]|uniref:Reverse transcriptase domain-containing protein n=1 Tax=Theobroma cacao TaxID=3641 RepID=A0A061FY28_THECC|nr:Uncharacterized protein TCM_013883 [Theobroma cacao]